MNRIALDRMLEKAVAEAIGVPYRVKPIRRAYKPRSPATFHAVRPHHSHRELQHA